MFVEQGALVCVGEGGEEEIFGNMGSRGARGCLLEAKNRADLLLVISIRKMKRGFSILVGHVLQIRLLRAYLTHVLGRTLSTRPVERVVSLNITNQKTYSFAKKGADHLHPRHGGVVEWGGSLGIPDFAEGSQRKNQFFHQTHVSGGDSKVKGILPFTVCG